MTVGATQAERSGGSGSGGHAARGTVAVIVTYGQRAALVARSVPAALAAGARHVVLVDNGAAAGVAEAVAALCADGRVTVIRHGANAGSAGGFHAGMQAALALGPDFLLLLDDDNVVGPGYIAALQDVLRGQDGAGRSAAIGLRAAHGARLADPWGQNERNSFLGFHLRDLPAKVARRMGGRGDPLPDVPAVMAIGRAPYGGLLLPATLCAAIGLPDRRFVLYEDDTEYTLRVARGGGHIWMVPSLLVEDIDRSWTVPAGRRSALAVWVTGGPEFRVFYTMRNHSHVDRCHRAASAVPFWANVVVYGGGLVLLALLAGRPRRAALFVRAMVAGLTGRLGVSARYPLP